jgi:hypothetical protein
VFRRGTVIPDLLPKVTPSGRRFHPLYQNDMRYRDGAFFKVDGVSECTPEHLDFKQIDSNQVGSLWAPNRKWGLPWQHGGPFFITDHTPNYWTSPCIYDTLS